jgi:hypothetical protein
MEELKNKVAAYNKAKLALADAHKEMAVALSNAIIINEADALKIYESKVV